MSTDTVKGCIEEILETIDIRGGYEDPDTVHEIDSLCRKISYLLPDAPKLTEIHDWIRILCSSRRHRKFGGAEKVRRFIWENCVSIEAYSGIMDEHGRRLSQES